MARFRAHGDRVEAQLDAPEREALRLVAESLGETVRRGEQDAAMQRLFPAAYPDDPEAQEGWSAVTEGDLREARVVAARTVIETLDRAERVRKGWRLTLTAEEVEAWMSVLNDARLVLGMRLGVTEDWYERPPPLTEDDRTAFEMYLYLGWVLTKLLHGVDPGLAEVDE